MNQEWNFNFDGLQITIKNLGFKGEELYINGSLADKTKSLFGTARLIAKYEDKLIKANIGSHNNGMKADVFIDDKLIFSESIGLVQTEMLKMSAYVAVYTVIITFGILAIIKLLF